MILRNGEGFQEAAATLEHIGQYISGQIRGGLGAHEQTLRDLAAGAGAEAAAEAARLLPVIRDARNMAVHEGAWARHLSTRLVDLFIILEEAIMEKLHLIADVMVRGPVTAETWQTVAHVRRPMLANSFSTIPVLVGAEWHLITDAALMRYVRAAGSKEERIRRLQEGIGEVLDRGAIHSVKPNLCAPTDAVERAVSLMDGEVPLLVIEPATFPPRLVGIVSAFDLL